jgi:hypothetical protein
MKTMLDDDGETVELDPPITWEEEVKQIFSRYPNHFVVCIDMID